MAKLYTEDDFPLYKVLQGTDRSIAAPLKTAFEAASDFGDDHLQQFAHMLFVVSDSLSDKANIPDVDQAMLDDTKVRLFPIFEHYAMDGHRLATQFAWSYFTKYGPTPDREREKYWEKIEERNAARPTMEALENHFCEQRFEQARELYEAGIRVRADWLVTLVANAMLKSILGILEVPDRFGFDVDAQDQIYIAMDQEHLAGLPFDTHDPFCWQGKQRKNSVLIMAAKKGWMRGEHGKRKRPIMGDVMETFLQRGANPDLQDGCGNTALHIAVMHRDVRPIKALLQAGADRDITNNGGLRASDLLQINYADLNPFLYRETGGDVNRYIHTLLPEAKWQVAETAVRKLLTVAPGKTPALSSAPA